MHISELMAKLLASVAILLEVTVSWYSLAYVFEPEKHSLSSWFARTPPSSGDLRPTTRGLFPFLVDFAVACLFGVLALPVIWKWVGWFLCFCIFVFVIQSAVNSIHELPLKTKLLGGALLGVLFVSGFWSTANGMWREEFRFFFRSRLVKRQSRKRKGNGGPNGDLGRNRCMSAARLTLRRIAPAGLEAKLRHVFRCGRRRKVPNRPSLRPRCETHQTGSSLC